MEFLAPVISLIVGFLSFVLVLRTWLQFCRVDPRLPISQTLLKITEPMVSPVGKLIPTVKNICFPALLIAAALVTLQFILFGVDLPRAVLIGLLSVVKTFGQIPIFHHLDSCINELGHSRQPPIRLHGSTNYRTGVRFYPQAPAKNGNVRFLGNGARFRLIATK